MDDFVENMRLVKHYTVEVLKKTTFLFFIFINFKWSINFPMSLKNQLEKIWKKIEELK